MSSDTDNKIVIMPTPVVKSKTVDRIDRGALSSICYLLLYALLIMDRQVI